MSTARPKQPNQVDAEAAQLKWEEPWKRGEDVGVDVDVDVDVDGDTRRRIMVVAITLIPD